MTGTTTKSAMSKAGDRKAMEGAWPNRVSGRQNGRLGSAMRKCVATRVSQGGEKAWRTALGAPNMPEGDPNGECRLRTMLKAGTSRLGRKSPARQKSTCHDPNQLQAFEFLLSFVCGWLLTICLKA